MGKYKVELKWATILIVSTLMWMILEKLSGLHDKYVAMHSSLTNLLAIVVLIVYLLALQEKRAVSYDGVMTWKQGFISGLIISAIVSVFSPILQLINHYFISPDFFTNVSAEAVRQGIMTQDQATHYFNLSSYLLQSVTGALLMGLVISGIASLVITNINKKSNGESTR